MAKKKKPYPRWKLVAWRFGRTFVAAFLVSLAADLVNLETIEGVKIGLLQSAFVAGVNALGKAIRVYSSDSKDNLINKAVLF